MYNIVVAFARATAHLLFSQSVSLLKPSIDTNPYCGGGTLLVPEGRYKSASLLKVLEQHDTPVISCKFFEEACRFQVEYSKFSLYS